MDENSIMFSLISAAHALQSQLEQALGDVGLSRAKLEVLDQLVQANEPLPLRTLADGQRCVPSNMTTLVDRLEADGLVQRVDDPADRRIVRAELTELGRERAAAGMNAMAAIEANLDSALPKAEGAALRSMLASLKGR